MQKNSSEKETENDNNKIAADVKSGQKTAQTSGDKEKGNYRIRKNREKFSFQFRCKMYEMFHNYHPD
ncbi:unknown [Roseburia sp. CAG:303]|nr:unknown [Roseburia sp. CAG:303]